MNKVKLFVENFLVYGLGGIISRAIPLVMMPVITRMMPDSSYFGISDLSNTAVQLASALAVGGMYDAMYRMFFEREDEEYRKDICSTALSFVLTTSVLAFILMLLGKDIIAQLFFGDRRYTYLVYITAIATLVGASNNIVSAPTRMQNRRKIFLVTNTLSPIISYAITIPLIIKGYYVIALPLAGAISGIVMEVIFVILNHKWFTLKRFDKNKLIELLVIAIPLIPNFLIYWIFNSSDKLMIANLLGTGEAGIYSVGAKLGYASQLIYMAFAEGWQYFAFSTMKEENQVKSNSMVFEYLGVISFAAGMFMCAWSYPIFRILFTDTYIEGYIVAPYLFLAPLLQMLFQIACNQFLVVKKTWPNMLILSVGAGANILMNLVLIPKLGIEGAAIATLGGYIISDIIAVVVLCKMKLMVVSTKFLVCSSMAVGYFIIWRALFSSMVLVSSAIALLIAGMYIVFYWNDISVLYRGVKNRKN